MALPPNLATPTLVTGKTNQSQVIDVYAKNPEMQDNTAQNTIPTTLAGSVDTLFTNVSRGIFKVIGKDNFVKDMRGVLSKAIKGGLTAKSFKDALKDYRKGALSTILESTGIGDPRKFKDNFIKDATNFGKEVGFGYVKGIVDNIVPGVLEKSNIKNFEDVKNVYKGAVDVVRDVKNLRANDVLVFLDDNPAIVSSLSSTVISNFTGVIDTVLAPPVKVSDVKDVRLDNAVLCAASVEVVQSDDSGLNEYMLDSFGANKTALMDYLKVIIPIAVQSGSYNFILHASRVTDSSTVSLLIREGSKDFLSRVNVSPLPENTTDRLIAQEGVISALEIVTNTSRSNFKVNSFNGITDSVYQVLKYGQYGNMASIARTSKPLTAAEILQTQHNDFIIT